MSNYLVGHDAEKRGAKYLEQQGFRIQVLNWKTKYCEIDIVAQKDDRVYFVEVKYRRNEKQGHGLEYVTVKKLQQMTFAAEMWVQHHNWQGEYQLGALSIDGDRFTLVDDL